MTILLDRPAYRLEFCLPIADAPGRVPRSQRRPSFLLDPQRQVVRYHARRTEQQQLSQWRDEPDEPLSVVLLHGPGGQGKTRLGNWFASQSHGEGWAVAQAVEKTLSLSAGHGVAPSLQEDQPLLVAVDYAERWHVSVLVEMIDNLRFDYPGRRVRVLLLARPESGWWESVAAEIDGRRIDRVDPIELGPFTPQGPQRRAVFVDAAEAFAHALEIPAAPVVPPGDLDHPAYASPLTVHMAALAAVTATQEGCESPGRHELSRYLLTHEYRYWNAAASETVPYSIRRTVFVATLFGPIANERQARALLRQAGLADGDAEAERLVRVHEKLYPTSRAGEKQRSPTPGDVLLPLHPDRLGEDFVAEELAPGSGRADADATG